MAACYQVIWEDTGVSNTSQHQLTDSDVRLRFTVRRNPPTIFHNCSLARIICSQGKGHVAVEQIQQKPQVTSAAVYILLRVETVLYAETRGRGWNQLHQPASSFRGNRVLLKSTFEK